MAATRLSESQKSELLGRFRGGESSQELAVAYGCSPNTVSRVVKAALDPQEYESLKQQRGRRALPAAAEEPSPPETPAPSVRSEAARPARPAAPEEATEEDGPSVLAIDDAEDFGGDDEEEDLLLSAEEGLDEEGGEGEAGVFLAIPVMPLVEDQAGILPVPLTAAALPGSAYLLVDKTVELQARPLSEFPELGGLPEDERERQALVLFANPRQAKRHCGRTQRVIKLPDPSLLERTAPYLLAQGISRVVIEGALYSLPGS